jgi:hypothetical protein
VKNWRFAIRDLLRAKSTHLRALASQRHGTQEAFGASAADPRVISGMAHLRPVLVSCPPDLDEPVREYVAREREEGCGCLAARPGFGRNRATPVTKSGNVFAAEGYGDRKWLQTRSESGLCDKPFGNSDTVELCLKKSNDGRIGREETSSPSIHRILSVSPPRDGSVGVANVESARRPSSRRVVQPAEGHPLR